MTKPVDLNDDFTADVFQYLDRNVDVHASGSVHTASTMVQDGFGLSRSDADGFAAAWVEFNEDV